MIENKLSSQMVSVKNNYLYLYNVGRIGPGLANQLECQYVSSYASAFSIP